MPRYTRQEKIIDQTKLKKAKVLIAGVGGLGSPVAMYLAGAGIGKLIIIDHDTIEDSNLNRQILYNEDNIGKLKVEVAREKLKKINSKIDVEGYSEITEALVKKSDVIVDCLDNWESREKLWKFAFKHKKPVVHGGIENRKGQVAVLTSKTEGDLILPSKKKSEKPQVLGATAGLIGSKMSLEVLEIINSGQFVPKFVNFDGSNFEQYSLKNESEFKDWDAIVIRVSEIWLKSKITKKWMTKRFVKNIKAAVPECTVTQNESRLIVSPYSEESLERLQFVFGVKSISPILKVRLDEIEEKFRSIVKTSMRTGEKFRVTVNRQNKAYPMSSMKLQAELGAIVKEEIPSGIVNLKNFDRKFEVEIQRDFAHIFTKRIPGPGGMPEGVEGNALALFSGGIDSPVAAWMLGKRGVTIDFLFMNPLGPILETKVLAVFQSIRKWFPTSKFWIINTEDAVNQITSNIHEGERQVILKRFLYRLAEKVSEVKRYDALITGESIGQASSQTLQAITVLNGTTEIPVLRPLIGMDKEEIIKLAKKIGSYESSSKIPEFCSIESHSNAHPRRENIEMYEEKVNFDFDKMVKSLRLGTETPFENMTPPKNIDGFEIVFLLKTPKYELKKDKKYIFICKAAHKASEAAHLAREQGFEAFVLSEKDAIKRGLKF